jgi:hypothetical protein
VSGEAEAATMKNTTIRQVDNRSTEQLLERERELEARVESQRGYIEYLRAVIVAAHFDAVELQRLSEEAIAVVINRTVQGEEK